MSISHAQYVTLCKVATGEELRPSSTADALFDRGLVCVTVRPRNRVRPNADWSHAVTGKGITAMDEYEAANPGTRLDRRRIRKGAMIQDHGCEAARKRAIKKKSK